MSGAYVIADPFPLVGDEIIDVTTHGYKWYFTPGEQRVLNWSLSDSIWVHPSLRSVETQADMSLVFIEIEKFIDVDFNYIGYVSVDGNRPGYRVANELGSHLNITFAYSGTNQNGVNVSDGQFTNSNQAAFCRFPDSDFDLTSYPGAAGDTWLNYNNPFIRTLDFEIGTNGFALVLHEVLHGLGLKHPHDDGGTGRPTYSSLGIQYFDRQWVSVMSYDRFENGGDGAYSGSMPITPLIFDVIALQYLYGESNLFYGDSVYDLTSYLGNYYRCMWDHSGEDTLDGTRLNYGIVVDVGLGEASNGVASHHIGYITSDVDALLLSVANPLKWTWLWGEYENVNGTRFSDVIKGNDLDNVINGGFGDDYLEGRGGDDKFDWVPGLRAGADTMIGGLGNDTYVIDWIYDVAIELSGEGVDTIIVGFDCSLRDYPYFENLGTYSDQGNPLRFTGNAFGNRITGGGGGDHLSGQDGSDTLHGNDGADTLLGGLGNDSLSGGAGEDALDGDEGRDTMVGGAGNDTYVVRDSADLLIEEAGAAAGSYDFVFSHLPSYRLPANIEGGQISSRSSADLIGNSESNYLWAGVGNNFLSGLGGSDTVSYEFGLSGVGSIGVAVSLAITSAQATGRSGWDTLIGIENLVGSARGDSLTGSIGGNFLAGLGGNDSIFGGDGHDTLSGGLGRDSLVGGAGRDVFLFQNLLDMGVRSAAADVIVDFSRGFDKIDLSSIDANTNTTLNDAFSAAILEKGARFVAPGQLRWADGFLYGNTDWDSDAEFAIYIGGTSIITSADIVL